ncbi:pimeloyl-ACP methyl ester carboxylesterase [Jatrophihabitans sp. GAS493]|uniref:alpha/beta fold hydrolase n=1 Tax=Jatrophihabitans sp. GAS493 TaxID=1907575 RepID=UPI000BC0EC74|nr:alpha/beta hydrolase [Jatrophihabitans sp. GAS493]SOD74794.1 pimeloyl-ACP methyl ester carboxylesterase [Jatrophihabitans sp. GAS493]
MSYPDLDGERGVAVSADGTSIGFVTAGSGPALLLVHGGMSSSRAWGPIWPQLTECFRVTAMDRRGRVTSGDGPRYQIEMEFDDIAAVAAAIVEESAPAVDVVAHSYGATCAVGAAAGAGAGAGRRAIGSLLLYEPPGPATVPPAWVEAITQYVDDGQAGRAMMTFLTQIIDLTPEQLDAMRRSDAEPDWEQIVLKTMPREAAALLRFDPATLGGAVQVPTRLLLGSQSPQWARQISDDLLRSVGGSDLRTLPEQGHLALTDAPELIVREILEYLPRSG